MAHAGLQMRRLRSDSCKWRGQTNKQASERASPPVQRAADSGAWATGTLAGVPAQCTLIDGLDLHFNSFKFTKRPLVCGPPNAFVRHLSGSALRGGGELGALARPRKEFWPALKR